jgi:glycosyltransferase involved in cell wall biosynthesis
MSKPETLVILTPAFPANEADSNWLPAHHQLVKALKDQFPAMDIVVLAFLYPHHAGRYDWNGVRVISFNGMNRKGRWQRLLFWRDIWRALRQVRRQHRVIGIFSFWCGECALIGHYFGLVHAIRHRCWISGQDAQKGNKWVKLIRPRGRELVAMSNFLRRNFRENYGIEPAFVIPNGIDAKLFTSGGQVPASGGQGLSSGSRPPATGSQPPERDIDILAAGSLVPLKQYEILVRVVDSLQQCFPDIKALHCGEGEEKGGLQSQIIELGLEGNLCLLGEIPHREVLQLMQRAKIFLHPSSREGFSTVCLEALYAGAQVISFCDPADKQVPEWHIVENEVAMVTEAISILDAPPESKPVLLHSIDENARAVMELFR